MKAKVLFVDKVHPLFRERLQQMGFTIEEAYHLSAEEINWGEYKGMVVRSRIPLNEALLAQCRQMDFIARVGAGLENIDLPKAQEMGITVLAAPEGNRNAVGEQALGMLLALFNRMLIADAEIRQGTWLREENRGLESGGKTIGLLGYGHTGSAFAKKLSGLDCKVLAYDKYKSGFSSPFVEEASMERIQAQADVLSLHLPQSAETNFLVDTTFINQFEKDFFLINTARGSIVKTSALIEALESGKVRGACLDVLEFEKSSFEDFFQQKSNPELEYLLKSSKVILSPHIAGWTQESKIKMAEVLLAKIEKQNL